MADFKALRAVGTHPSYTRLEKINTSTDRVQGVVNDSDYNAIGSVLVGHTANNPVVVALGASTILGRPAAGNSAALTATQVRSIINVEDGAEVNKGEKLDATVGGQVFKQVDGGGNLEFRRITTPDAASLAIIDTGTEVTLQVTPKDGLDTSAIHDDTASEISAITEKTDPTISDFLVIEDAADSNAKKRVLIGSLPGTSASGADWKFKTPTADADPGVGNFRLNTGAFATATFLFISDINNDGVDVSLVLASIASGATLYIQALGDASVAALYTVNGTPTDATTYWKIPLTFVDEGAGGFLANNQLTAIAVSAAGGGGGDMIKATYDPALIAEQLVGLTASQTLTSKTLTQPTIGDFRNAEHDHEDAIGGGALDTAALTTGKLGVPRGGTDIDTMPTGALLYGLGTVFAKRLLGVTDEVLTVAGGLPVWALPAVRAPQSKGATIFSPGAQDDVTLFRTPVDITVTAVHSHITAGTNVIYNIYHASTRDGTGLLVFTVNITETSESGAEHNTGFNDATIPADNWVWVEIISSSGLPTHFHATVEYTED